MCMYYTILYVRPETFELYYVYLSLITSYMFRGFYTLFRETTALFVQELYAVCVSVHHI